MKPFIKSLFAFMLALGVSLLCAFVEIALRCATRQPGLVLHCYKDVFSRARRIHASLNKPPKRIKTATNTTKRAYSRKPRDRRER